MTTLVGITIRWALRFLKQIGTQDEPGCNSLYIVVGTMEAGQLGAPCWLGKHHVDPHTVPPDICVAMYMDGPKVEEW